MNRCKLYFCISLLFLLNSIVWSQIEVQTDEPVDSIEIESEKPELIENLQKNKHKSGFNRLVNNLFLKDPRSRDATNISERAIAQDKMYILAQGKIIRDIHINTYKPFGYSLEDSTRQPDKFIEKAGNSVHVKTRKFVIKNYLLQKPGDAYDSLKIMESERLIRRQRFTRRVNIEYELIGENLDSVDLYVSTLDSWTIFPNVTFSGSRAGFRLRERNFLGLGHDFDNYYRQNFETGDNQFQTRYTIPNIQKTYIGFSIGYSANEENEYRKGVALQRRFFSPLTRWAGGISFSQRAYQDSIPNNTNTYAQNIKYNVKDFWGGYAFPLAKIENTTEDRLTNLIVSARYFNVDYQKRQNLEMDPERFYANEDFLLMGIGISKRGFAQDRFIQNYNIIEDIPVGMSIGLTSGFQRKNSKDRFYLSGRVKMGNYFNLGYFGFDMGYGGFKNGSHSEQTVFSLGINYFTRLMTISDWRLRNFISSHLIIGNNRVDSRGDRLTLNENDPLGIDGFYSLNVIGTKKWLTNIQVQSYSPYQVLGFRISPILSSSFGLISDQDKHLLKGKVYSQIGIGVLLTNDYLVFSNFQLSFSWYNSIPGYGENIFKTNTYQISDYELMDFDFGKPELIEYNPYVTK